MRDRNRTPCHTERMTQTEAPPVEAPPSLFWSGPLAMEDVATGDGRRIMPEALTWRDLPLPLMFQSGTPEGQGNPHAGAEWAGRITVLWRDGAVVHGAGTIDSGASGEFLGRLLSEGPVGVSVDLDDVTSSVECLEEDADGECVDGELQLVKGRVMGVTGTPFPALPNAQIALVTDEEYAVLSAEHGLVVDGEVEPHEFEDSGDGTCVECGLTEAEHDAAQASMSATSPVRRPAHTRARTMSLAAVGTDPLLRPPESWFQDPGLPCVTPLTVTDQGRVLAHAARWGQPHIALAGRTPPKSKSGYAYYNLHGRRASCECPDLGGEVEVAAGVITLGTGHADRSLDYLAAMAHYDNTGFAVADVVAGEDEHGIWVTGALRPGLSEERIIELRGASLSGDWRWIGGSLEFVASLCVNVPGFPTPRQSFHVSEGRETALVAAGIVPPARSVTYSDHDHLLARVGILEERAARQSATLALLEPQALSALSARFDT